MKRQERFKAEMKLGPQWGPNSRDRYGEWQEYTATNWRPGYYEYCRGHPTTASGLEFRRFFERLSYRRYRRHQPFVPGRFRHGDHYLAWGRFSKGGCRPQSLNVERVLADDAYWREQGYSTSFAA